MRVLVVGASGFVAKHIYQALKKEGYEVEASSREWLDFCRLSCSNDGLIERLREYDVVINAVGIIAQVGENSFEQVHTIAPIALFDACQKAGIKRVIQISALGSQSGTTAYHTSKDRADHYLRQSGLSYAILHPSVIYGDDGKSTALFQALASLPIAPIIAEGQQLLQPVRIEDMVQTVKRVIVSKEQKIELDVVGERAISYQDLLATFRKWLGYESVRVVSMPTVGTNLIGKLLQEPTVHQDNIKMLEEGNHADVAPLADFLGYAPIGIRENLQNTEASNAQKLYASLYLLRPLLRLVIGLVWVWSGIVSLFLYPRPLALDLLHEIGIVSGFDLPMLYVASFLDIVLGVLTILGYRLGVLLKLQIVVIGVYTLLLTLLAPHHWLHPFGPVLKNIPLIFTIYILMKLERYR